ncbi:lysine decarboxylase-like protein [Penicillium verhagenii]|nr:lysine decarboxylase-like protein [Penicillium verhagenii]
MSLSSLLQNSQTNLNSPTAAAAHGRGPVHLEAARTLAQEFHEHSVQLVYGGGTTGLMGEVAPHSSHSQGPKQFTSNGNGAATPNWESANSNSGGKAAGRVVVSESEQADGIPESEYGVTTIVPDMHTRKRLMATKVLEGGPGSGPENGNILAEMKDAKEVWSKLLEYQISSQHMQLNWGEE